MSYYDLLISIRLTTYAPLIELNITSLYFY
jgi:hypothetical protein